MASGGSDHFGRYQKLNTQYAAQRLAQATGDYTVSIWEYMRDGRRSFTLKANENFGIVTPTYFQGMPLFLQEFLSSLKLEDGGRTHYTYAVSTCGVLHPGGHTPERQERMEQGTLSVVSGLRP